MPIDPNPAVMRIAIISGFGRMTNVGVDIGAMQVQGLLETPLADEASSPMLFNYCIEGGLDSKAYHRTLAVGGRIHPLCIDFVPHRVSLCDHGRDALEVDQPVVMDGYGNAAVD